MDVSSYSKVENSGLIIVGLFISLVGFFVFGAGLTLLWLGAISVGILLILTGVVVVLTSQVFSYSEGRNTKHRFKEKDMPKDTGSRFRADDFTSATDTSKAWRSVSQEASQEQTHNRAEIGDEGGLSLTVEATTYEFFDKSSISSLSDVESQYKELVKKHHPDTKTGTVETFKQLQNEYKQIKKEYN